MTTDPTTPDLDEVLAELVQNAVRVFGPNLLSVVLFGSAAEQRLRPSSDVNLLFLLERFAPDEADAFREPMRTAHTALRASAMFLCRAELPDAADLFAVKFWDIRNRHRVLHGTDPFAALAISDAALRLGLREVLLNLALRLRERYVRLSLREEQLVPAITDAAGPLRVAAAALLALQGQSAASPREALERVAAAADDPEFLAAVRSLHAARQELKLPAGIGGTHLRALGRLADHLRRELEAEAA